MNRVPKQKSSKYGLSVNPHPNPFYSDDKFDHKKNLKCSGRTSSEPSQITSNLGTYHFDDEFKGTSSSQRFFSLATRNKYKNDFRNSGGLENQTVQKLENYAVYRPEGTTKSFNNCLKIVEDMREYANITPITLHQQGEQITRTHMVAVDMDHDLSRGEKLLESFGGIFSKIWKPKKTRPITGPVITRAVEKMKQDDTLSDLSNIMGELNNIAIDMESEIDRQNKALDHVQDDDVLNI